MSAERALIDTNVLVYSSDSTSPHNPASTALLAAAQTGSFLGCVSPQILLEFVSVVTNPKRVASARAADEAWMAAEAFAQAFELVVPPIDLFARVATLGRTLGMKAQEVFDLAIGITAVEAGVGIVYTYDSTVFSRVPGLIVREPPGP